jgi:hypothetical protein
MKIENGSGNSASRNYQCMQSQGTRSSNGQTISALKKDISNFEKYEKTIKYRMQDRQKFMSAKNAIRYSDELNKIDQRKGHIRAHIRSLQESPNLTD